VTRRFTRTAFLAFAAACLVACVNVSVTRTDGGVVHAAHVSTASSPATRVDTLATVAVAKSRIARDAVRQRSDTWRSLPLIALFATALLSALGFAGRRLSAAWAGHQAFYARCSFARRAPPTFAF
jgi:hypothetical protein